MLPFTDYPRLNFSYSLAMFILPLAVFLSLYRDNWEFLSRAGALLVLIGIWLTIKSIDQFDANDLIIKSPYSHPALHFKLREESNTDSYDDFLEKVKDKESELLKEKIDSKEFSKSLLFADKFFLIFGTFLWGFGDLFPVIVEVFQLGFKHGRL